MVVPGELAKYLLFADRLFHSGTTRSDADTHRHTATAHHQGCAGYHCVILDVISHYCCDFVIFKQVLPLFRKQRNEFFFTLPRKIHFFYFCISTTTISITLVRVLPVRMCPPVC